MRRIPLNEFTAEKGQTDAANLLGLSQAALSKALGSGRSIIVTDHEDGTFSAEEFRPFPFRRKRARTVCPSEDGSVASLETSVPRYSCGGQVNKSAVNPSSSGIAQ